MRIRRAAAAGLLCGALTACGSDAGSAAGPSPAVSSPGVSSPGGSSPDVSSSGLSSPGGASPGGSSAGGSSAGGSSAGAPGASPAGIPASALLQPADVGGAQPEKLPEGEFAHVRPVRPCGDEPYPSDRLRTGAVAMRYLVRSDEGSVPTIVTEFLGRGGAAEQFADIRAALDRCPGGLGEGQRRWSVIGTGIAGDESVLVRIDERFSYADEEPATVSQFAGVARSGDMLVVVTDVGWENLGGSEELVRELTGKAVRRAG
ncbi:hypothetical protein AB0F72_39210 [Actinoplanes sp. NPDC023936]|uniref:hypothetical protein n=1 Tax=Actinoplanes sp. NPDC023936 TaxID=3154910 RepID=UPI0033E279DD